MLRGKQGCPDRAHTRCRAGGGGWGGQARFCPKAGPTQFLSAVTANSPLGQAPPVSSGLPPGCFCCSELEETRVLPSKAEVQVGVWVRDVGYFLWA